MSAKPRLKSFKIVTTDGGCQCVFLTSATDNKDALNNLLTNSWDFKNVIDSKADLTIKIKRLKK